MSDDKRGITKSAAHRFGLTFCPACNADGKPAMDISPDVPCAWCWNKEHGFHARYVTVETLKKWRVEHGLPEDEDEIPTSPESRQALQNPPASSDGDDEIPDTDPAPKP